MSEAVELLSRPMNFAVVQLPERKFPGIVVQGDTLNGLVRRVERMSELLNANKIDDLGAEMDDLREELSCALTHYESVCTQRGIALPYVTSKRAASENEKGSGSN